MTLAPSQLDAAADELRALLGDRFTTSAAVRDHHGRDEGWHTPHAPDGVCFAQSTEEVSAIVAVCARHGVPIVPFGAGTSLEGQVIAERGGVCVDLTGMNRILEVHAEDLDVVVQAGVTRNQLNEHLKHEGLFFPIDPGADATLGGMASTRASGTNAVRYGTMRENTLALTVVLADGRVIRTSRRARKSSAGYDLTRLFVGSEGTLGIITEVTVRVHGIPEAMSSAVVTFGGFAGAVAAVIETIQVGIPIARIEFLDEVQVDAVNRYSELDLVVAPTLFCEFHGSESSVAEQARDFGEIASRHGGSDFAWTVDEAERRKLWQARHDAYHAARALRPGCEGWPTDVCVPISRLADCILETKADLDASSIVTPIVGHVGDGNFHLLFLIDPDDQAELAEAKRLNDRLVRRALAMDGTCTGEHGIGIGKREFLVEEHGADAVEVMRSIKAALDPTNLFNPGNMFL